MLNRKENVYLPYKQYSATQKLVISGIVLALYVVIMYLTQGFAFMTYQIRIATSLYALSYLNPFLILPLTLANGLSNLIMGGLGAPDVIGGAVVGLITTVLIYLIRRFRLPVWLNGVVIVLVPGLGVATWLSVLLSVPYPVMALSLCIGQIIPGIVGVLLIQTLKNKI